MTRLTFSTIMTKLNIPKSQERVFKIAFTMIAIVLIVRIAMLGNEFGKWLFTVLHK